MMDLDPQARPVYIKTNRAQVFAHAIEAQLSNAGLMVAVQTYLALLAENPNDAEACNNLALALSAQAQHKPALMAHRKALRIMEKVDHPDLRGSHSGYCMSSLYSPEPTADALFETHRRAGAWVGETVRAWPNPKTTDRKLRIGFLSWDFREHSVMFFLMAFWEHYDRDRFEVSCYYDAPKEDAYTAEIRGFVDHFHRVERMSTDALVEAIVCDRIDVLVDLSGHTARRLMDVFSVRAAPVQVMYCGYPATSGLETMDYRIVDGVTDPEGYERHATETLVRLPRCFLCYTPAQDVLETCPEKKKGPFTFGSFNAYNKLTDPVLESWAEILKRAPGTRLFIKATAFKDPDTMKLALQRLEKAGIPKKRVELAGREVEKGDHFRLYEKVDLMLDATPYNGTVTTCEALYHGIPVLTVLGDRHVARVSASLLTAIGHPEMISADRAEYIAKAVRIAKGRMKVPRGTRLRETMQDSMLMDGPGHTRAMEAVLAEMWRRWAQ